MPKLSRRKQRGSHFTIFKRKHSKPKNEVSQNQQECESMENENDTSSDQEVENPGMQITPVHDLPPVRANVKTVSDIIVIDNINDRSNPEKPWVSLKGATFEDVHEPPSPTDVIVIAGPSSAPSCREQSYASDMSQQDSYDALCVSYDTSNESCTEVTHFPSETQCTLEDLTSSEAQPFTITSSLAGTSRERHLPSSSPERATSLAGGSSILLLQVKDYLLLLLPKFWIPIVLHDGIHVYRLADRKPTLVQRSLFFSTDGTVTASVNGKDLSTPHPFWQFVQETALGVGSVKEFSEFVSRTVNHFRSFEICKGVEEFRQVWKTVEDAEIDHNRFHEHRFNVTLRSSQCLMVVPSLQVRRCSHCQSLWTVLRKRSLIRDGATHTPEAKKSNKHLNTPQKSKRIAQKSREIRRLRAANWRYRQRIESLIWEEGICVDDSTAEDFTKILTDKKLTTNLTDFQRLFLEQQIQANSVKSASGMRWHPAMIRLALSLSMTSPAAYEELSGILILPSRRTLFDYSHALESKEGCHEEIIEHFKQDSDQTRKYDFEDYNVVATDDVHLKRNLVLNKHTGQLIGYVKLNEVDKELAALKEVMATLCKSPGEESKPSEPPLVEKMLSYMITNVATGKQSVIACYGVSTLTKEKFYEFTWDVIGALERSDLPVIAVVCDGAGVNRGFFQMHPPVTTTESGTVFDVINIYAPERVLYFLTDALHLLKTCRNCLFYSGKRNKKRGLIRNMQKNGKKLEWKTVEKYYAETKGDTLRKGYKLNEEDVYLNSYSRMRVSLAAHVLSRSFATEIRLREWEDDYEVAIFCETMNDLFDMLNGKSRNQDARTRNELLAPYSSCNDPRFDQMLEKWSYFEKWSKEVDALPLKASEKAKRTISRESLQGLERTVKGFRSAMQFVLKEAAKENPTPKIVARVFQQDDLEHYFSKQRASFGGNRHPDLSMALQANVNIHQQKELGLKGAKKGNTKAKRIPTVAELSAPLLKRKRVDRSLFKTMDIVEPHSP